MSKLAAINLAEKGKEKLLKQLIFSGECDINERDKDGETALHKIAKNNHLSCIDHLVILGSTDYKIKNNMGFTALELARQNGHHELAKIIEYHAEKKALKEALHGVDLNIGEIAKGFPRKWRQKGMTKFDVEDVLSEILDDMDDSVTTRATLNSHVWNHKRLEQLVNKYSANEGWGVNNNELLVFWENGAKDRDEPIGFASFWVSATTKAEERKSNQLRMGLDLVWIRPDLRGQHLSKHLAAHFVSYLHDCDPSNLVEEDTEWAISYMAELYSRGGEVFSGYIEKELESLPDWHDNWQGVGDHVFDVDY